MKYVLFSLLAIVLTASFAQADTILTGTVTADNAFIAYLSTSPTALGAQIGTGTDWGTSYTLPPFTLTAGTTYYLQINGHNGIYPNYLPPIAGPGGIIGSFTLGDASFQFSNGSQSLNTDSAHWTYAYTIYSDFIAGVPPGSAPILIPTGYGANGVGPWGARSGISGDAQWIWDTTNPEYQATDLFFETTITPLTDPTPIPEPGSMFLLGSGLLAISRMVSRRRRTA